MNKKENIEAFVPESEDFIRTYKAGLALVFLGRTLYFNNRPKRSLIFLRRLKKKVDKIIDLVSYLLAVSGVLAFLFWIYLNFDQGFITWINFYESDSFLVLWFLISFFFLAFIIYRRSEAQASLKKIKVIKSRKKDFNLDYNKLPSIEVNEALSEELLTIIENSYLLAQKLKQKEVSTIHLFWSLLRSRTISSLFIRLNVNIKQLVDLLKNYLASTDAHKEESSNLIFSDHVQEIILAAFTDAYFNKQSSIGVLNVILFSYQKNPILQEILYELNVSQDKIVNAVKWFRINEKMRQDYKIFKKMARLKPASSMNRAYTSVASPTVDYFSRDMTVMAKYGYYEFCVARDQEIRQIFESLEGGSSGVLLVGQNGCGKRTIIEGIAQLMVKEEVPHFFKDKRLVELDVSRLLSGTSPSQAQDRILQIINEMRRSKNIILYIENIENIMGISAGAEESLELSEVLAETLSRRGIYCLASVDSENYTNYIEGKALAQVMSVINVKEPDFNDAVHMIESKIAGIEGRYGIYFDYNSIEAAVNLSVKYINDKFLPAKAIEIIRAVAVKNSKMVANDPSKKICSQHDVAEVVSDLTGILVSKVSESESEKLLNLEEKIHNRMIGQEEAVKAVAGSLRRARAQLREGSRPIASFLFLGPTGVGKTELAKSVSEIYFGAEDDMIRLDMSEYQLADSVKKMIGDTDGTLGYLTEAVRKKPFSLILFDEIEKSHPDILNLFLQILDDGRLTDGQGRTINFTNTIIISTSNAGALFIQEAVKENMANEIIKQTLIDEHLIKVMRPELINRFDGIIVFKPLTLDNILSIAKLMINKMAKNLETKGIELLYDDAGLLKLAKEGYDPKFGARPLRRLLQDKIENEIANLIIGKQLDRRDIVFINERGEIETQKAKKL